MTSRCRSCEADIRWERTLGGKRIPLDLDPSPLGNVQICEVGGENVAVVLGQADVAAAQVEQIPLYLAHFATCPDAEQHRTKAAA